MREERHLGECGFLHMQRHAGVRPQPVPVDVVVRVRAGGGHLPRLRFQLLQAHHIGSVALQPLAELRRARADAVHVPGGDLHSSPRTMCAPCTIARSLPSAMSRGRYFMPQSGATTRRSAGTTFSAALIRPAIASADSTFMSPRSSTPSITVLFFNSLMIETSSRGWAASMDTCRQPHCTSSDRNEYPEGLSATTY